MAIFRCGHASGDDWESAARSCLLQIESGARPADLGFLYVTDPFAAELPAIVEFLRVRTGVSDWVGSVGMSVCATATEYHQVPAMSILLASLPEDSYRVFSGAGERIDRFESEHGAWCRAMHPILGVVHADPRHGANAEALERVAERMGDGFLIGALSSGGEGMAQVANGVTAGGVSGVMFDSRIAVATRLTQGCRPIGERHVVTACDQNIVYELDGRPATEVLFGSTGDLLARSPQLMGGYIFVGIPIRGSDTGDYIVRHIVALDREAGAIAIDAALSTGDGLMFCRRDGEAAAEDLQRMVGEARRGLQGEARGALYFSCVARGPNLFGRPGEELRIVAEELGAVPLAGFFGNGEISSNRVYGYTAVLALFA